MRQSDGSGENNSAILVINEIYSPFTFLELPQKETRDNLMRASVSFTAEDEVESRTRIFQTVIIFTETNIFNLCEDSRNAFWLILELDNSYIRYRINCDDSRWIGEIISFGIMLRVIWLHRFWFLLLL